MSRLTAEHLDSLTPNDVVVTDTAPGPNSDPTAGTALGRSRAPEAPSLADPDHPLVTIGDSLTHGVTSGAVYRTELSWPALAALALGQKLGPADFAVPSYRGPLGGLPLNIEGLLRKLQAKFGNDLSMFEKLEFPIVLQRLLDGNEDYWERGDGSKPAPTGTRWSNLGIYGWDLRDALESCAGRAVEMTSEPAHDGFFGATPDHDNDIAAASVLAPFGPSATQLSAADSLGAHGGIGTLVVALGSNNALDAVVSKAVKWSGPGFDDLDRKAAFNVWRPTHFAIEFNRLVTSLKKITATRVVLATVPHVTVAPIAKGVNTDPKRRGKKWEDGSRYFPYYCDPWIEEKDFRPDRHRHITHQQARAIDSAIDQYNVTIVDAVRAARKQGRQWFVLDLCGLLDGLAYRRYEKDSKAAADNQWVPYELPKPIEHLDSRFFRSDRSGRLQGGLFGLDGIHPTTSAYGVVAHELLQVLAVAGVTSKPIDFTALLARDTLNSDPPALVNSMLQLIAPFATRFVSRA
ncbi:MAG: hypothetical protein ABIR32_02830 [Ilumatobacteraceae bacterium]